MRLALGVEYHGGSFCGWQRQKNQTTIQGTLENSLSQIADHSVKTICAGRTDTGVHALGQVVHFDTDKNRPLHAWLIGTNTYLPKTISLKWVKIVPEDFHARFSAKARTYQYFIHNVPIHSALTAGKATWYRYPLDVTLMQRAAQYLVGEHDFSSFRSSQCESLSPVRLIEMISIKRLGEFILIEVTANAFLHHMVRNMVGSLLRVGGGRVPVDWMKEILLARDRRIAAETALPDGLYLYQVHYSNQYDFPKSVNRGFF